MYLDINVTTLIEGNESVDGMVIVDKFDNQNEKRTIKTCPNFANQLSRIILKDSQWFSEMGVLFDKYNALYLKPKTREIFTSGIQIQYKIDDRQYQY